MSRTKYHRQDLACGRVYLYIQYRWRDRPLYLRLTGRQLYKPPAEMENEFLMLAGQSQAL